jgi:transcription elongation factor SPT6
MDEFADFIEEDDLDDDEERLRQQEEMEVARPRDRGYFGAAGADVTGLDQDAIDDMAAIFGNGEEYEWALALEEEAEAREGADQQLELKDVFEPSQLAEKLLTDEDNQIRWTDEPERFQLDRKPFKHLQLTDEESREEARWITNALWPKKSGSLPQGSDLRGPFQKSIGKVLEFFVVDEVEVPYVFQHRKDYLIHAKKTRLPPDPNNPDQPEYHLHADKLLNQDDLWTILDLDLKFRAFVDKRRSLEKMYDNLQAAANISDHMLEDLLPEAATMEELQDLQDYIRFTYSAQLKDIAVTDDSAKSSSTVKPGGRSSIFDRVRSGQAYTFVKAYGITVEEFAKNAVSGDRDGRNYRTEDPSSHPLDLADTLTSDDEFKTGDQVMLAGRQMFAEEMVLNPCLRKHFRMSYFQMANISCFRTDKGLRRIDDQNQYYELKYLRNLTLSDLARKPELFLKMLKAEQEGLLEINITLQKGNNLKRELERQLLSDGESSIADAWNDERRKALDMAMAKLDKIMVKSVKENMRNECESEVLKACREEYSKKLDQAPYKPKGMALGTVPRVLALSCGGGTPGRDPVYWAWVEDDGRALESGKFKDMSRDEASREDFVELVQRRGPDVIAVSGWGIETQRLVKDLKALCQERGLRGVDFEDPETGDMRSEPLEVVVVNDEVARLYRDSPRAINENPGLSSVTRYCIALARYMQNPMKEYAALDTDIISLVFHPCQSLVPETKMRKQLDTAMVDMVNLCGVDINEAVSDPTVAKLLPYVCGLGPRKATAVLKTINMNGGAVNTRDELVGDPDSNKLPVVGPRVWNNCASFLMIEYDPTSPQSDYLDNTRVHPEDYELGRKMAADALELDEEDVKAEVDDKGPGAVVRKLIQEGEQEKVNDLILEEYAEQLEQNYNQRKRATLETIRAELQQPYEELRRNFAMLSDDEIFTILTGETKDTLYPGMPVAVNIRVVKDDFIIARLDSGLEAKVEAYDATSEDMPLSRLFSPNQTVPAKILSIDRRDFIAKCTLRKDQVEKPFRRDLDVDDHQWDERQEMADKEALKEKDKVTGRTQRVIKHPLFRPFNSIQAEEYLGSQAIGDAVIRPSSRGHDHLTVTWKVADGVYQHIDVLELQKENEFTVGKQLRIGGKFTYSDLDELIVDYVKAMARKVEEMMQHEKYRNLTRAETGKNPAITAQHTMTVC